MSYFTAVLAREGRKWFAHDIDIESAGSLSELADQLRQFAHDDEPVLAFVEREDAWWGVVRVDGDEDPRVFVSDAVDASATAYSEIFAIEGEDDEELAGCAGDFDVLSDLGTPPERLQEMCDDQWLPIDALSEVSEAGGFADVLDSLR